LKLETPPNLFKEHPENKENFMMPDNVILDKINKHSMKECQFKSMVELK